MRISFFIVTIFIMFAACEPEPILQPVDYTPKLVIDGWIEQGAFPQVMLTKSSSYFGNVDSVALRNMVVSTAKVTVSDGIQEEVLTLKKDENFFPPYIYKGTQLKGEVGKTYTLTVETKGERYTATTTIPAPEQFEELWFETVPGKDSLGYVYGKFTDDGSMENFYRVFTQREHKDKRYVPVYLSAIGDQYFNGKSFTFSLLRGPDTFTEVTDDLYFKVGDTIKIKFCTMDKAHFDFWRTLERELYVVGNPFSSSGNEIISNIDNKKALGVWGGYGVTYYKIIARK